MVMPVEEPTSKASVLWPPLVTSPALLSILTEVMVRFSELLMLKPWTGVFLMLRPVMLELIILCAAKNLGYGVC
jgi:hypothetical protein